MSRIRLQPRFYVFMSVVLLIVFGIVFLVSGHLLADGRRRIKAARAEQETLTQTVSELRETLTYRQSDAYVERVARDELNMIMPGEYRYTSD